MYKCPNCKKFVGDLWEYCEHCNIKLFVKCPICDNRILYSEKECSNCGFKKDKNNNEKNNIKNEKIKITCKTCKNEFEYILKESFDVFYCRNCRAIYSIEINKEKKINIELIRRGEILDKNIVEALKILKLDFQEVSMENLKRAWKRQIDLYHPDKVNHLGDDIKNIAEEKTKAINEAYNKIKIYMDNRNF